LVEDGLREMRQGLDEWRARGAVSHRPYQLALLAEALGQAGRVQEGQDAVDEALRICAATGERFWEVELHRLRGEMLPAGDEAEACFRQALAVAGRQGARSLELRAASSLARLCRARESLAAVYGWFTEGLATADLREAKSLLDELG
jgi:adenylate cyclase